MSVPADSLKRRRDSRACARCRKRKIKCDLQYPTCGACSAARVGCWGFDTAKGLDKPRSAVRHLEDQVARLEIELANLKTQTGSFTKDVDSAVQRLADSLATALVEPSGRNGRQEQPLPLVSKYFLSESPLPHVSSPGLEDVSTAPGQVYPSRAVTISSINRHVVDAMLKHYCETYRPQYPAIAEEDLYDARDKVYENPDLLGYDGFMVYITLAISSNTLMHIDEKRAATTTYGLWEMAVTQLAHVGLTSSWERLQALQLLAHYGFLNPQHVNVSHCAAAATRLAFQLGLHEELASAAQRRLGPTALNSRRRMFWNAYGIDAAAHAIPDTESQETPTHSAHVWTLREIESDVTIGLYHGTVASESSDNTTSFNVWQTQLRDRLEHWYQAVRQSVNLTEKIEFHELLFQVQILRLNRASPRCPIPTTEMRKRALKAAIALIREFSIMDRLGKMFMLWHAAHCLVEAGVYLLLSIVTDMETSIPGSRQLGGEDTNILVRYTKILPGLIWKIAYRWPSVSAYASALDTISTAASEGVQQWLDVNDSWRSTSVGVKEKIGRLILFSPEVTQAPTESAFRSVGSRQEQASVANFQLRSQPDTSPATLNLLAQATDGEHPPSDSGQLALRPGSTENFPYLQDPFDFSDMMAWDFSGIDSEEIFAAFLEGAQSESMIL